MDVSMMVLKASKNGKEGIITLLYELDKKDIYSLERHVLKELDMLKTDKERTNFCNNIVLSDSLPICKEFTRIIIEGFDRKSYIKAYSYTQITEHRKAKVYDYYEFFMQYSNELKEKKERISKKNEEILSKNYQKIRPRGYINAKNRAYS